MHDMDQGETIGSEEQPRIPSQSIPFSSPDGDVCTVISPSDLHPYLSEFTAVVPTDVDHRTEDTVDDER